MNKNMFFFNICMCPKTFEIWFNFLLDLQNLTSFITNAVICSNKTKEPK